jgi:hypothetical protein
MIGAPETQYVLVEIDTSGGVLDVRYDLLPFVV